MSTIEKEVLAPASCISAGPQREPILSRALRLLCSVRLGVILLCVLVLACMVGMIIMQQNVDGFETYYAALTPAERLVYWKLGFFNIYHSWYFNALLCLISLNLVLASVDRFPKTWKFISSPKVRVPLRWLEGQTHSATFQVAGSIEEFSRKADSSLKVFGWRRIRTAKKDRLRFVFGESGVWNRLGGYAVHVSMLTILLGGFLTSQFATGGEIELSPGEASDLIHQNAVDLDNINRITKRLPFEIAVTDIEQKLVRTDGPLDPANTLDWITRFIIRDETGVHVGVVKMNQPFDYRGYRFYQASFTPVGRARRVTLELTPTGGGRAEQLAISRGGTAELGDGTRIKFTEFRGNFRPGPEDTRENTSGYPAPAAVLEVTSTGGTVQTGYALGPQPAHLPLASQAAGGYVFKLVDFERVADKHVLSVRRDPGANIVYLGFGLMAASLATVFFFSHQRVWVSIEEKSEGDLKIITAGHTNRNPHQLSKRFLRFVRKLRQESTSMKQ